MTHLWLGLNGGVTNVLCGADTKAQREFRNALRPEAVTCGQCLRRLARWEGGATGLPSWTAYQVDSQSKPGKLIVSTPKGDVEADPGDWLLDLGGVLDVLPGGLKARADA